MFHEPIVSGVQMNKQVYCIILLALIFYKINSFTITERKMKRGVFTIIPKLKQNSVQHFKRNMMPPCFYCFLIHKMQCKKKIFKRPFRHQLKTYWNFNIYECLNITLIYIYEKFVCLSVRLFPETGCKAQKLGRRPKKRAEGPITGPLAQFVGLWPQHRPRLCWL